MGVVGLLDSGASASLFPVGLMAPFGIAEADCVEIDGVTANGPCHYWHWQQGSLTTTVQGTEVHLAAMFGPTEQVLLGRGDFFTYFKVSIDQRSQSFRLYPY
jgi:hypothetical protein